MRIDDDLAFVSVIVPTYNEEKNIARCLRSIKNQNYPQNKVEVIVVDGMSEDNTVNIAKNYSVRIIINKKRIVGNALKLGVEEAKGEIIAVLNADSEIPQKDWLRRMVSPFSDPEVCGTLSSIQLCKSYPAISRCYHLMGGDPMINFAYASKNDEHTIMTEKNFYPTGPPLYRRELVINLGNFKPFLPRLEDVDMAYRLVKNGYKFVVVPKTYLYHLYVDNLSSYIRKTYKKMLMFTKFQEFCEFKFVPRNPNNKINFLKKMLSHMAIVGLLLSVIEGIRKDRDFSWLYYPVIVLVTVAIQAVTIVSNVKGRKLLREFIGGAY